MRKRRNFKRGRPVPGKERLPRPVYRGKHFVYRITVNGVPYIGYTSRSPYTRLAEHLENARNGSKGKLYNALRKYEHDHLFEIVEEFDSEYNALCREILLIAECSNTLNMSPGGEGRSMRLERIVLPDGSSVIKRRAR